MVINREKLAKMRKKAGRCLNMYIPEDKVFLKYNFREKDKHVYRLCRMYEEYMIEFKDYKFYQLFKPKVSPKEQTNKWNHFRRLYNRLVEEEIDPKNYFFYHFVVASDIKNNSYMYYFISSDISIEMFMKWKRKLAQQGTTPDQIAYRNIKEKKEKRVQYYDSIVKRKMHDSGTYTEEKWWMDKCGADDLSEFPSTYLKKNSIFMKLYRKGYFKGLLTLSS